MSRIGLGLAALGRPGYQNVGHGADIGPDASVDALRRRSHAVLDAAWAGGVRYVDAARSYGRAEEFLASWIAARGIAPGELTVGSKWGYRYTAGWSARAAVHEVKDHSLGALREQLAESRRHLGAYLRLYQIHSATLESGVLDDAGVL
ncbi:MAG: aldo/keto reductase, partial [Gemmatimonadota bacterium]|nr:aldo/keto reductase [Gemmatimonadota bacterium]